MLQKATLVLALIAAVSIRVSAGVSFDALADSTLRRELAGLEPRVPQAAPAGEKDQVSAPGKAAAEWTIMVFINGKNNLEPFALKDMNEMELVGSSDKVNIVVETGRMAGYGDSDGDWQTTRRYLIRKDDNPGEIASPVLQDLGQVDMGDYRSVVDFGNWAKAAYPAKKYMLVLWNHGSGWNKGRAGVSKGISYDDETGNNITTPQLGLALKEMGGVDVYGSDACLMQMAEVAYEIKDYVPYIVGSEETEPDDGYAYDALLAPLVARPDMTAEELGRLAVDAYSGYYEARGEGYTQSLINTAALPKFAALTDAFAAAMTASGEKPLVKKALFGAQSYLNDSRDLAHFAGLMSAGTKNAAVRAAADALRDHIAAVLVAHNRAASAGYADSHGIAVYLPAYLYCADYDALAWAGASRWNGFIKWYRAE